MKNSFNFTKYLFALFSLSILFTAFSFYALKQGLVADPQLLEKLQSKYNVHISLNGITTGMPSSQVSVPGKSWTFPATAKKIVIKSLSGDYSIKTSTDKEIKISVSGDTSPDISDKILKVENSDDEISLTEPSDDIASNLSISIELPADYNGQIEFFTRNGDFSAENLQLQHLTIKSISGEVHLSRASIKDLEIETTSGDVHSFGSKVSNLKTKTISGDVEFENTLPLNIEARSVSGSFDLRLQKKNSAQFFLKSVSGNITNELGSEKSAKNKIEITTLSGDIRIE